MKNVTMKIYARWKFNEFSLLYKAVREVEVFCQHNEIQTSDPRFNKCQVEDLK